MDNIWITIITSIVTALTTTFAIWLKMKTDLRRELASRYNQKKWDVYSSFTKCVREMLETENDQPGKAKNLFDQKFMTLASELLLVGSDDVIAKFRSWRIYHHENGIRNLDTQHMLFQTIIEMRKDLGNEKTEVDIAELLRILVPSFDKAFLGLER